MNRIRCRVTYPQRPAPAGPKRKAFTRTDCGQWTAEEDAKVVEMYGKFTSRQIGNLINRSALAVRTRAIRIGLSIDAPTTSSRHKELAAEFGFAG